MGVNHSAFRELPEPSVAKVSFFALFDIFGTCDDSAIQLRLCRAICKTNPVIH
jgi:hypothetical protein